MSFLSEHDKVLSGGLFAGTMSLRWRLLDSEALKTKITSGGTKTIEGRKAHVLNFFPTGGSSELKIKLYFDAETYNHLGSEYHREISSKAAVFGRQNQIANTSMTLTEHFSDVKSVDRITLPDSPV